MSSRWDDGSANREAEELARRQEEDRKERKASRKQKKEVLEKEEEAKRIRIKADEKEAEESGQTHTRPLFPSFRTAPSWAGCRGRGRFRICNRIKEGSYGWVSRATDLTTGEMVALKKPRLLEPSMRRSPQGVPISVLREISLLKLARNHPNIVTLREVLVGRDVDAVDERETEEPGLLTSKAYPSWDPNRESAVSEDGLPRPIYLVLDLIDHDLGLLLRNHKLEHPGENYTPLFSISETKTILQEISSGLSFLHSHWIIHRDIKPSNILLDNRGQIRIADFGMARLTSSPPSAMTSLVVTLLYRAPELILRKADYQFPVDVWSVGCIFAELLTDEPLFMAATESAQWGNYTDMLGFPTTRQWPEFPILFRKQTHITTPPEGAKRPRSGKKTLESLCRSRISEAGFELLSSMLAMNPDQRPSATELAVHAYWNESPKFKNPLLFPSFPSVAKREKQDLRMGRAGSEEGGEMVDI